MKPENGETVLELLLSEAQVGEGSRSGQPSVAVGTVRGFDAAGAPLITLPGSSPDGGGLAGQSIVYLNRQHVGRQVVVAFEHGDVRRPIIMGLLQQAGYAPSTGARQAEGVEADLDGETLVLSAKREIVLRCGRSSITLTRAGKVLIKGAYVLSRSSGVNRIKGASVQIN
jgi:hypothetical protein